MEAATAVAGAVWAHAAASEKQAWALWRPLLVPHYPCYPQVEGLCFPWQSLSGRGGVLF